MKFEIKEKNKMNVKPKFLNVMKRFLISMMALGALVVFANKSFAQSNLTPVVGVAYSYSVSLTASGDGDYTFSANQSTTTAGSSTSSATISAAGPTAYTAGSLTATTDITWLSGTESTTYNVWIELVGTGSYCTNRRYVQVTPQANTLSATIFAYDAVGGSTATSTCPDLTGNNFDNASSPTDGTTMVYFKVTLNDANDSGTWEPGISITGGTGTTTYSYDGGSTFGAEQTSISTASTTVWVQVEEANSTTPIDYTASISPVETLSGGQTVTTEASPSNASLLLKGLPFTGTVTFN